MMILLDRRGRGQDGGRSGRLNPSPRQARLQSCRYPDNLHGFDRHRAWLRGHCWPRCGIREVGPPPEYIEPVVDLRPIRRCRAGSRGLLERLQDSSVPCKASPVSVRGAVRDPVALRHTGLEDFRSPHGGGRGSHGSLGDCTSLLGVGTTLHYCPAVRYVWAVALFQDCHLCLCCGEQLAEVRWGALSYNLARPPPISPPPA
ncbi:hypothetical protein NDU88_005123 [Pleurodeles waltl]|uniref:Uncharacterized protein n=1 Tax=Pleurodeles waltl TaxID=8319 RepID=A0AAV7T9K3_PLEWA|nr:hypothetical protein NDU88_005123 [Pleurodeles waltl]